MSDIKKYYDKVSLSENKKAELKAVLKQNFPQFAENNSGETEVITMENSLTLNNGGKAKVRSKCFTGGIIAGAAALLLVLGSGAARYAYLHNAPDVGDKGESIIDNGGASEKHIGYIGDVNSESFKKAKEIYSFAQQACSDCQANNEPLDTQGTVLDREYYMQVMTKNSTPVHTEGQTGAEEFMLMLESYASAENFDLSEWDFEIMTEADTITGVRIYPDADHLSWYSYPTEEETYFIDEPENAKQQSAKTILNITVTALEDEGLFDGSSMTFDTAVLKDAVGKGFDESTNKGRLMKTVYEQCELMEIHLTDLEFLIKIEPDGAGSYESAVIIYQDETHTGYYSYPMHALENDNGDRLVNDLTYSTDDARALYNEAVMLFTELSVQGMKIDAESTMVNMVDFDDYDNGNISHDSYDADGIITAEEFLMALYDKKGVAYSIGFGYPYRSFRINFEKDPDNNGNASAVRNVVVVLKDNDENGIYTYPASASENGEMSAIPDVSGYTAEDAEAVLLNAGFANVVRRVQFDDGSKSNTVIKTEPEAGQSASADESIVLYVSNGPLDIEAEEGRPSVTGMKLDEAKAKIAEMGLRYDVIYVNGADKDTVVNSSYSGDYSNGMTAVSMYAANGRSGEDQPGYAELPLNDRITENDRLILRDRNNNVVSDLSIAEDVIDDGVKLVDVYGTGVEKYTAYIADKNGAETAFAAVEVGYEDQKIVISMLDGDTSELTLDIPLSKDISPDGSLLLRRGDMMAAGMLINEKALKENSVSFVFEGSGQEVIDVLYIDSEGNESEYMKFSLDYDNKTFTKL
ncbi:PASTA domain-containing protein [uncultured Ruminococcus sp.]|uniref:PASTA domain-containing protein n=1 Tax=uncultured Ruminococcus sp. TaxID=165186 RepID=UPI0025D8007A|nr:PASTA domain-containing protein [uncultured Ruminococcus sp.]